MRIVFMGSAEFACPTVEALLASRHELVCCVTQADRPRGRHLAVTACPVKIMAAGRGFPVMTPERVADSGVLSELDSYSPDIIVVAAYGQYLPGRLLSLPRVACVNIHPSLLPKYRGAAPIQWAVAGGDTVTGVTILHVAKKMDAGDIILQEIHPIDPDETAASLERKLAKFGAELLLRALGLLESGAASRTPQDEARATWARKLVKEDGRLDWSKPAEILRHHVRGFHPWPGSFTEVDGKRLKILRTRVEEGRGRAGEVLSMAEEGPLIACGESALRLLDVQPEGRPAMSGRSYAQGVAWDVGFRLG